MGAPPEALPGAPRAESVLTTLRAATAAVHRRTEDVLDLTAHHLTPQRLAAVVGALGAFWTSAEHGLDRWSQDDPVTAARLVWPQRRRAGLFDADVTALGGRVLTRRPVLPPVLTTGQALGRLYVLEGSTLGGQQINAALAARTDAWSVVQLDGLAPYGTRTGAMWHDYREVVTSWPGDPTEIVDAALVTFTLLEAWVAPLEVRR